MSELPGATCPHCGAEPRRAGRILRATPVLMNSGLGLTREYLCWDCGARWGVEGRQEALFPELEVLTLPFE